VKIAIILPAFYLGGFERWASFVYKALSSHKIITDVYILGNIKAHPSDYGIDLNLRRINLIDLFNIIYFSKYNCIITGLTKLNLLLSFFCFFSNKYLITSIHLSLHRKEFESLLKFTIRKFIHKLIYKFSDKIICVSNGIFFDYLNICKDNKKLIKIYNPCFNLEDIFLKNTYESELIKISCAGRLGYQKGFDILIEAFNNMPNNIIHNININLYGPDPDNLWPKLFLLLKKDRIDKFKYHGPVSNLHLKLRSSDIFILSSRYEGFGNVLVEALSADCFCVAFDSPHGPSEILSEGKFGILIKEISAKKLSSTLSNVISSKQYLNRTYLPHERFSHLQNFTSEAFYKNFHEILNDLFLK